MRRRQFIALLGGAAAAWPLAASAQQREPLRRVAILVPIAKDTLGAQERYMAFLEAFEHLGWTDGRNVQIMVRWGGGNEAETRKYAEEIVALAPDVILTVGVGAELMLKATRTIPVVFANVPDPMGSGFVQSLSRPGGNATGFMMFEYSLCGKWPELLKEIAPSVTHAAVLRDPTFVSGIDLFLAGEDLVKLGLVTSLAKPDGNLTGINILATEVVAKRLELLRELLPKAIHIDVLADPANATTTESMLRDLESAARRMGMRIQVLNVSTVREIDAAFAALANERPDALFVGVSPFLLDRRVQLAQLAARHAIPAIYQEREHAEVGGLMSYGASIGDAYRQLGVYAGRVLKGAKPADLPVVQSSKFELVINHSTARMLGLTLPPTLLSITDDVIE